MFLKLFSAGKSSVLLDVKPWDDETDMQKLEEAVRSVQMEGLTWGACESAFLNFLPFLDLPLSTDGETNVCMPFGLCENICS